MSSNAHAATQRNRAMADKDCVTLSYFFFLPVFLFQFVPHYSLGRVSKSHKRKKKQLIRLIGPRLESETQGPEGKT